MLQSTILNIGVQRQALRSKIALRRGQIGSNVDKQNKDKDYRYLLFNEAAIAKILQYDQEEQKQSTSNQANYLRIALTNYRRWATS